MAPVSVPSSFVRPESTATRNRKKHTFSPNSFMAIPLFSSTPSRGDRHNLLDCFFAGRRPFGEAVTVPAVRAGYSRRDELHRFHELSRNWPYFAAAREELRCQSLLQELWRQLPVDSAEKDR